MNNKGKRKIGILGVLIGVLTFVCVACSMPAYAAESSSVEITIEAEAAMIDVTVSTTMPMIFNADGSNTLPENFTITNHSNIADVCLKSVRVEGETSGWKLLGDLKTAAIPPLNQKEMQLYLGEKGAEKLVVPEGGYKSQQGECFFEDGEFVIPKQEEKVLSFQVQRGYFTKAVPTAKAFDMTLQFAFAEESQKMDAAQAGLYDENGNLLYAWDTLVDEYGWDVESNHSENASIGTMLSRMEVFERGHRLVVKNGVEKIGNYAFSGSNLEEIVLPDSVTEMGMYAFFQNAALQRIQLSNNLKIIPIYAFGVCGSLKEIVLPEGLKRIEAYAFRDCKNLETVSIPSTVEVIDLSGNGYSTTFMNCVNLENIYYSGSAKGAPWGAVNANLIKE